MDAMLVNQFLDKITQKNVRIKVVKADPHIETVIYDGFISDIEPSQLTNLNINNAQFRYSEQFNLEYDLYIINCYEEPSGGD